MQAILPWLLISLILITAWPWAAWLLTRAPHEDGPWLVPLLTLALSTGTLTLLMFWQALIGMRLTALGITLPYFALMLPGGWLWWRGERPHARLTLPRPQSRIAGLAALVLTIIAGGVLFNSIYWPFWRDDPMGIYVPFAVQIADTRTLVALKGDLTVYEAYPILMPLAYSYAYLIAGWPHEFLARLFPALLSLGCLGTTYTLGRMLRGPLAGWIGTLLLALTPTFGTWASSGYVDLPMAFFYSLSAIFAWRLRQTCHPVDALLTGIALGLAAWTKNAALLGIALAAVWLVWMMIRRHIRWQHLILALGTGAAIAGPWYLRNLIEAGLIIPDTAWTEQASRTIETLLVLITRPEIYSLPGVILLLSLFSAGVTVIRRRFDAPDLLMLMWWSVPFFVAWWLWVSYDPRFLLLFLPIFCVIGGIQLAGLWDHLPHQWQQRLRLPAAVVIVGLGLFAAWNSVEFKDDILRHPIMTAEERRIVVFSELRPWDLKKDASAP